MSNVGITNRKMVLVIIVTWMLSLLTILPMTYFFLRSPTSPYAKITSENIDVGAVTSEKISNGSISADKLSKGALPVFSTGTGWLKIDNTTIVDSHHWADMFVYNITVTRRSCLLIWLTTKFYITGYGIQIYMRVNDSDTSPSGPIDIFQSNSTQTEYQTLAFYCSPYSEEYGLHTLTIKTIWRLYSAAPTNSAEGFAQLTVLALPAGY